MVVDAEVLRDPADASAAVEHRAADAGDDLVDRDHERVGNANVSEKTTEGSESFSPRRQAGEPRANESEPRTGRGSGQGSCAASAIVAVFTPPTVAADMRTRKAPSRRRPAGESHRDETMPGNALQRSRQDRDVGLNVGPGRYGTGSLELELSIGYSQPRVRGDEPPLRPSTAGGRRDHRTSLPVLEPANRLGHGPWRDARARSEQRVFGYPSPRSFTGWRAIAWYRGGSATPSKSAEMSIRARVRMLSFQVDECGPGGSPCSR